MKAWQIVCILSLSGLSTKLQSAERKVYFYNWSEYLPDKVIKMFEKETSINVIYSTYDSNEAMYTKVKLLKDNIYDIVVPTTNYVQKMIKESMLEKIDKGKIPNFKNLDDNLLGRSFDPGNNYSIPYFWGTTLIAYNEKKIDGKSITSWRDLWKPEYKRKLLLLNDYRDVFFLGMRTLGHSANTIDPRKIEEAYKNLGPLMANVRIFESQSPKSAFLAGEVNLGAMWNGEIYMAQQENPAIKGIFPKEGGLLWMDSIVIPKTARNKEEAYALINFLLRPEIGKIIAEEVGYSSPNRAAVLLLDEKIRNNPVAYPPAEEIRKGEFQEDLGSAVVIYEKFWEKLKVL